MDDDATELIEQLNLMPHPEGGWYRETWRGPILAGGRAGASAIHFLLEEGQRSHWHKVDATEIWLWHAGSPLRLRTAPDKAGPIVEHRLGGAPLIGDMPQLVIPPHHWQAADADEGWALVSCIVSPGFDFAGFTLAPPRWAPGK